MSIKNIPAKRKRLTHKAHLTAFSLLLLSTTAVQAEGQPEIFVDYSHPNITIDLSVIGDGGYQAASPSTSAPILGFGASDGRILKMPGAQAPRSMLHVPKADGQTLPAMMKPKTQAVAKAPAPVQTSPKPVKKTAGAPVKKSPPAPMKKPEPAPEIVKAPVPKAPPAMPAKPVEVAKAPTRPAAPAMPEPTAKSETSAPPPAPVVKPAPKVAEKAPDPAPTPPPTPKATTEPSKEQASLPPAGSDGKGMRVEFGADQTKLPEQAKAQLVDLANSMKGNDEMRLQLMAYAGGPSLSSSLARRMSLSRALSIRSFLIENGVRSTRIDVRALGNKTDEEPVNRVDLNVSGR